MVKGPKEVVVMRNLARVLRMVGLVLTSLFAGFGILFAAGYGFEDPGGWQGVALFACMVVPLAVLTWLARSHPAAGLRWVLVGAGLLVAWAVLEMVVDLVEAPVLPIAALVLSVPAAVLGLRDARRGAELLLLIAVAPVVSVLARVLGEREGPPLGAALGGSTGVVVLPLLLFAAVFLVAAAVEPRHPAGTSDDSVTRSPSGAAR
jgi:hypothetical protein